MADSSAQLRITSFKPGGMITWTNYAPTGAYTLQWSSSPKGPWNAFTAATDLNSIWATTNRVTIQVPTNNSTIFYRVAYIPPNPVGLWDYYGYDMSGFLITTGQLSLTAVPDGSPSTNPGFVLNGSWNLQYVGPPTDQLWRLGPQIGSGNLGGSLASGIAHVYLKWPTNIIDGNIELSSTIYPNSISGTWGYSTLVGRQGGTFEAKRH